MNTIPPQSFSEKKLTIMIQSSDGLTTASCPELGVVGFGRSRESATKEVYDAIINNSKIVLKLKDLHESFRSEHEKILSQWAPQILSNEGNIQSLFYFQQA